MLIFYFTATTVMVRGLVSNRVNCSFQVYNIAHRFLDVDLVSRMKEKYIKKRKIKKKEKEEKKYR